MLCYAKLKPPNSNTCKNVFGSYVTSWDILWRDMKEAFGITQDLINCWFSQPVELAVKDDKGTNRCVAY